MAISVRVNVKYGCGFLPNFILFTDATQPKYPVELLQKTMNASKPSKHPHRWVEIVSKRLVENMGWFQKLHMGFSWVPQW